MSLWTKPYESVDEILWCYHSNETSSAVLSDGTIGFECSSNSWVCGWNPIVWPFKWNLFSSTFTWYYLLYNPFQNGIYKCCWILTYAIFSSERVKVLSVAHLLLANAYPKVGLVELIRNIPTQRTKIPPLLNERMEETQTEQQFFPNLQETVASLATATTPGRGTQQNLLWFYCSHWKTPGPILGRCGMTATDSPWDPSAAHSSSLPLKVAMVTLVM